MKVFASLLVSLIACDRSIAPTTSEASAPTATPTTVATTGWDGSCPRPLKGYSGYCDNRCRSYADREQTHHAQRIAFPESYGFGKCGSLRVYSERETGGATIVEYFDDAGALIGARDESRMECTDYGSVPACTPTVEWKSLREIRAKPHGVFDDSR